MVISGNEVDYFIISDLWHGGDLQSFDVGSHIGLTTEAKSAPYLMWYNKTKWL